MHKHHIGYVVIAVAFGTTVYVWPVKRFVLALFNPELDGYWPWVIVVAVAMVVIIGTTHPSDGPPLAP